MIDRRRLFRSSGVAVGAMIVGAGAVDAGPAAAVTTGPAAASTATADPTFLPLPDHVKPLPNNGNGYRLQRAGSNGYVLTVGAVQSVFVETKTGVVLVDAPPASHGLLQTAIKSVTDKPVTHVIYSHDHLDHIGSVTDFPNATRIAHAETARMLAVFNDPARPLPQKTFADPHTVLHIGGEEIHLSYSGPNHEVGNILTYFPAQRLAVLIDVAFPGWTPYRGWGNAVYLPGILLAHDAALGLDFDTFVGGHVYRTGTQADVQQSRDFFVDLWRTTQTTKAKILLTDVEASLAEPANFWAATTVWLDRIAQSVTSELIDRWGTKLAGADTFTKATVSAAIISMTTDDGPVSLS
jgi:glyoxylase-like metal-dependent hydrolase (beta-lactamase superfamily II)